MICRLLQIENEQEWRKSASWLADRKALDPSVENVTRAILENVRENGDKAVLEYSREFDCPDFSGSFLVSERDMEKAAASVPVENRENISAAASNIRSFHEAQVEKSWFITRPDGTILGEKVEPVDAVGLYVPGGKGGNTPLISSLLMNVIPAQVAGCPRIAIITPPRADGSINSNLLAAAHLLDIDEVYRVGGAWGIAALAYGTESIPAVDVIAGPGNIYVTTAKRLLHGSIGIDMIAGPSEILIVADSAANPAWVAADMLSQAEHDPLASAICLVHDPRMAEYIGNEIEKQIATLPREEIARKSLEDWGCVAITPNINVSLEIANIIAPEHLELALRDPWSVMPAIKNAGAIFMGQYSPEPVGDYFAGPNHVLPTLGTAKFSSALSVRNFCKKSNIIAASRAFLRRNASAIAALARIEGLEAHARSVETRQRNNLMFHK